MTSITWSLVAPGAVLRSAVSMPFASGVLEVERVGASVSSPQRQTSTSAREGQDTAGVWAAVAQVHATLALAAATAVDSPADGRAWADVAGTRPSGQSPEPGPRN